MALVLTTQSLSNTTKASVQTTRLLAQSGQLQARRWYVVQGRQGGAPDVQVLAVSATSLSDTATLLSTPAAAGTYELGTDQFTPLDFTLLSPVRVFTFGETLGFPTMTAAYQYFVDNAQPLVEYTIQVTANLSTEETHPNIDLNGLDNLTGNGVSLAFPLALGTRTTGCILSAARLRGTLVNCTLRSAGNTVMPGETVTLLNCTVGATAVRVFGALVLGPGTDVDPGFMVDLGSPENGVYTTPQGGTVIDKR